MAANHIKFMKVPLDGEELADFNLDLVPENLQSDKNAVHRELERDGKLDDPAEVYLRVQLYTSSLRRRTRTC